MGGMNDETFGPTLQKTLQSLSHTSEGNENVEALFEQLAKQFNTGLKPNVLPSGPDDPDIETADATVAETAQLLGQAQRGMEGFEVGKMEEVGESMMEEMMAQFEALGEKEDYNEVVDGIMKQLLSKELMYEPTRQVCEKFPEWLALHKEQLSKSEYTNYGRQYQTFQKILAVYDTEPDNFPRYVLFSIYSPYRSTAISCVIFSSWFVFRLMELMFDMQKYGQPPADIIQDLAPGLKFDENGMPIMPNMGAGTMPEMPGGEGLPDLGEAAFKMANGQCSVM